MSASPEQAAVAKQLDYCSFCPKMCRHACPVAAASGREYHTPQAKMNRLNELRKGFRGWSSDTADPLWACTGCRHCTLFCEHGNEPGLVLLAGRAHANARKAGHPRLENYPDRFRSRDHRLVEQLRANVSPDRFAESAMVGFWPGCDAVDKDPAGIEAALRVFEAIGADHVRLIDSEQSCGGYPLLAGGYPDMFRWHASKVATSLKPYKTVVINCSACLYTLRAQYPAEGVSVSAEILSLSEFLAQSAAQLKAPTNKRTVYYHDPCYLARYSGIIEPPRRVLGQVAEVREFPWSREQTECCGSAGLLPKTMPDVADAMARRRLRDIANRGGGTVVTSCASCAFMLKRNAPDRVTIKDLPNAVADALSDD